MKKKNCAINFWMLVYIFCWSWTKKTKDKSLIPPPPARVGIPLQVHICTYLERIMHLNIF